MYLQCQITFAWTLLPAVSVAWLKAFLNLSEAAWQTCAYWFVAFKVTPAEHMRHRSTLVSS